MLKRAPIETPTSLYDCTLSSDQSLAELAALFRGGKGYTSKEIYNTSKFSQTTVKKRLGYLKTKKLIHIHKWVRVTAHTCSAVYKAGSKPDAPRPEAQDAWKKAKARRANPPPATAADIKAAQLAVHCNELASLLVPMRNAQEQEEVNRMYLNWISEGIHG
jgi:hypothetical protein